MHAISLTTEITANLRPFIKEINLIKRFTSKIAVEVTSSVASQVESNELKPRKHPGIIKSQRAEVPNYISRALNRAIGDHPIKTLVKDAQRLNQYINSRHPPPEEKDLNEKLQKIIAEIEERLPIPHDENGEVSEEIQRKILKKREQILRKRMGERNYAWKPIVYAGYEALVYAVGRAAKEYAVLLNILREIQHRDAEFKPRSYFDFGSGIGTGMWAASSLWKDSIFEYFNVDSSREMNEFSELLLREANENQQMILKNVYYRQFLPGIEVGIISTAHFTIYF